MEEVDVFTVRVWLPVFYLFVDALVDGLWVLLDFEEHLGIEVLNSEIGHQHDVLVAQCFICHFIQIN